MKISITKTLALNSIYNKIKSTNAKVKTLHKLAKLYASIQTDYNFYIEKIQEYIEEYGIKDENGEPLMENGNYAIKKECIEECNKKIMELEQVEVEIPDNIKFSLEELENFELTLEEVVIFEDFIEE